MDTPNGRTANWLAELRRTPRKMQAIPEALRPQTLTQAYAVQERLVAELGGATIGYKTACTSALAREQLQVPHPLFGRLLSSSTYVGPVALRAEDFTLRTIEPEFAFHMRVDVPASAYPRIFPVQPAFAAYPRPIQLHLPSLPCVLGVCH